MDGIVEEGDYGPILIVTGPWSAELEEYAISNRVPELLLNCAKGWSGWSLEFLEKLRHLHAFTILDLSGIDIAPIGNLRELRYLEVNTTCKGRIDFSQFRQLERCALNWRPKAESLLQCTTLQRLYLDSYPGKDLSEFRLLINLDSLCLANCKLEVLHGIEHLKNLRYLGFYACRRLTDIAPIRLLSKLEELELDGCRRFGSIDAVSSLVDLRTIFINDAGPIESLVPIANLKSLEEVMFIESTSILDGDLSILLSLPRLYSLSFRERSHYSHRWADFEAKRNIASGGPKKRFMDPMMRRYLQAHGWRRPSNSDGGSTHGTEP